MKTLPTILAALLLAGGPALLPAAQAAAPQQRAQAPGWYRAMVGDAEVTALSDGTVTIPLDQLLTRTTPVRVAARLARSHLGTRVETSINAFLVNTGTHLVLVDTGAGALFGAGAGRLQDSIRAAGYRADDIDAVLLTHIHGDHSGGLAQAGRMLFPNATIHVHRRDAGFWLNPANKATAAPGQQRNFDEAAAQFAPYLAAGRVKPFDGATELLPGLSAAPATGHTPGHTIYVLKSAGQELRFWGDLLHAEDVQFPEPGVTIRFDVDSRAAAARRRAVFADAAARGYLVAAAHIGFPGIGYVRAQGGGYDWLPLRYSALAPRAQAAGSGTAAN
ncbi:MBL fold metallo-hydrolase [[Empedobacter] haloabium]|uniref:MBL fold metallo-hydrolase n=1 Tax=[Empedobacter] haloabium TaxID=592317 RepID=A0ABZ1USV1_9BURK